MDTATFLARVVAPGNYLALCYKGSGRPMGTRFFKREDTAEAAGFIRWADGKNMDVWFGLASYKLAEAATDKNGNLHYKGERTAANVDRVQCFWYDADIKRDGDGKDPSKCFANIAAVEAWAEQLPQCGIPYPSLWVRSGYGVHLYWPLAEPLARNEWQAGANEFKSCLIDAGARGDVGLTTDSARILRPPNTRNHKVPDQPAPVVVIKGD